MTRIASQRQCGWQAIFNTRHGVMIRIACFGSLADEGYTSFRADAGVRQAAPRGRAHPATAPEGSRWVGEVSHSAA